LNVPSRPQSPTTKKFNGAAAVAAAVDDF
jgi:hypothetical protein